MNLGAAGSKAQWRERVAGALWLGMAVVAYVRLFIGVDFTDEAFYSVLPHSFANGFRPYFDELNITQNAGILLTPLYWLFERITGGTDGIVLFNRHLFFAAVTGCACLAHRVGRAFAGVASGRLLAAFVCAFSYFNIPALSYNTLGALFLFIGVFLLLWQAAPIETRGPAGVIGWANLSFVAAAFAYPTLILASVAGLGVAGWRAWRMREEGDVRGVRAWVVTAGLAGGCFAGFLGLVGVGRIRAVLEYATSYGYASEGSGMRAVRLVLGQLGRLVWFWAVIGVWLAPWLLPAGWLRPARRMAVGLACGVGGWSAVVLARHPATEQFPAGSAPVVLALGLWLPVAAGRLKTRSMRRDLWIIAGGPAFLAAVAVAWGSTNGLLSATIGAFPAATGTLLFAMISAQESEGRSEPGGSTREVMAVCLMAPLMVVLGRALVVKSYRDDVRWGGRDHAVAGGPYAGIVTTTQRARRVAALAEDFRPLDRAGGTLLVLDDFPAGHLFTRLRPTAPSTWVFWSGEMAADTRRLREMVTSVGARPDRVLRMEGPRSWIDSELERSGYRTQLRRDEFGYRLLRREADSRDNL